MKRWLILMSVGCLAFASVASASVQQGDTELDALIMWNDQNADTGGADVEILSVSAAIGYFLTDNVQVQGAITGQWTELDMPGAIADVDADIYAIGGRVKYHFMPTNQWVPYIGAQVMWASSDIDWGGADSDPDGIFWGPLLGVRYELNAYNDFFIEYQYQMWEGDLADSPTDGGAGLDDAHALVLGLVHQFK